MRMTRKEQLKNEVEAKLEQMDDSYCIAGFETVHKLAKRIEKLGYKVVKHETIVDHYTISR